MTPVEPTVHSSQGHPDKSAVPPDSPPCNDHSLPNRDRARLEGIHDTECALKKLVVACQELHVRLFLGMGHRKWALEAVRSELQASGSRNLHTEANK